MVAVRRRCAPRQGEALQGPGLAQLCASSIVISLASSDRFGNLRPPIHKPYGSDKKTLKRAILPLRHFIQQVLDATMTVPVKTISDRISNHMRRASLDVMTMRWPSFYEFCERDRIKESFVEALSIQLKSESILLVRGHAVVAFVKDFDFSPMR